MTPALITGAKGGGEHQPQDAADTLRSVQRAEVVDLLGEGPIAGLVDGARSIFLDGVPVENADTSRNFADFGWDLQLGGPTGHVLAHGMGDVQTEVPVGVTVAAALPVVRTIADPTVDAMRITLLVPAFVRQLDNGDRVGTRVDFAIDVQSAGGGFVTRFTDAIEGKCTSAYNRSIRIDLRAAGPAPWEVRLRRLTPDSTSANLVDAFSWASYTAISGVRMLYRHSAAAALSFDARNFSAIPTRSYDVMGIADWDIPVNYDPIARTYAGPWNGVLKQGWTNNAAWVLHGLVKHRRYGMGEYTGILPDKWVLYQLAQWCDQAVSNGRGGTEPRYAINAYIQTQVEALRLLQDICAVFRGALVYSGSRLSVTWDAPGTAETIYTPANVVDGTFNYSDGSASAKKSSCTCWYTDWSQQGRRMPATWDDPDLVARYGMRGMEIDPLGVSSPSAALRMAKWALYTVAEEDATVNFRVGAQGASQRVGAIFQVNDPSEAGERLGGRVRSATATQVVLDAPVQLLPGESYTLWVTLADPADPARLKAEGRAVHTPAGTHGVIDVATPFSAEPARETMWLLEGNTVQPTLWRCVAVEEVALGDGVRQYQITGLMHQPGKWERIENNQPMQLRPTRRLSDAAPRPLDVVCTETIYLDGSLSRNRATVSWRAPAPGLRYQLAWRLDRGPWQTLPPTSGNTIDVDGPGVGLFEALVQSFNALANYSLAVPVTRTLTGGAPYTGELDATRGADASNLRIGLGLNMLPNSDFIASAAGWDVVYVQNGGTNWNFGRNAPHQFWAPAGGSMLYLTRQGDARTGVMDFGPASQGPVSVQGGKRYEISAYLAAHRQDVGLLVLWADSSGAPLFAQSVLAERKVGGPRLADWARAGLILAAPAAAAQAWLRVRSFATDDGQPDSACFATRCFLGEALPGQTELSPWAPAYFADARQLGYLGDLDATRGAPAGTPVAGVDAATVRDNAANALTAAGNAQTAANAANQALANIANDNLLTRGEKPRVLLDWTAIFNERAGIEAQAAVYDITTERTQYSAAVDVLAGYLGGLVPAWNDLASDTPIDGAAFRANFGDVYAKRQALLNRIAAVAGQRAAWLSVLGRPRAFRVSSVGNSSTSQPVGSGLRNPESGALEVGFSRSYTLVKIRRSDSAIVYAASFDVFADPGQATALGAQLNATGSDHIVVVYGHDEPQTNRLAGGLDAAMYRCGASRAIFGSTQFKFSSAYVLIGIAGCGEGQGFESYQGEVDSSTNAWCDVSFQVQNGALLVTGTGATPKTLRDYGYVGALDATAVSNVIAQPPAGSLSRSRPGGVGIFNPIRRVAAEAVWANTTGAQATVSVSASMLASRDPGAGTGTASMWAGGGFAPAEGTVVGDGGLLGIPDTNNVLLSRSFSVDVPAGSTLYASVFFVLMPDSGQTMIVNYSSPNVTITVVR